MAEKQEVKQNAKIEDSGKNSKGMMIVLFILGLLVLGVAAFGGVYLFMKTNSAVSAQQVVEEKLYTDLGESVVNLNDQDEKRYMKYQISVGYDKSDKKTPKELETSLVVVKDVVNFYFRNKDAEFVSDPSNEETMKKELIENINKQLIKGKITDIRFNSLVVQ